MKTSTRKCPNCGCEEIWDEDCPDCNGGEDDCETCEGSGYHEGYAECSKCGFIDIDEEFENAAQS